MECARKTHRLTRPEELAALASSARTIGHTKVGDGRGVQGPHEQVGRAKAPLDGNAPRQGSSCLAAKEALCSPHLTDEQGLAVVVLVEKVRLKLEGKGWGWGGGG